MLTEQDAIKKLESLLPECGRHIDGGLVVLPEYTRELRYGWIFFYTARRYAATGALEDAIGGNGPVVIIAATGEVVRLGTALRADEELARFEAARGLA